MDKIINNLILKENIRQNEGLELIASENYASMDVRNACGSILTNKYAEGYPNARYYGGCKYIDLIEKEAINRACKLFKVKYANVQPHSGSQANAAAYRALLPNGGKILSLYLNDGGHLTHGSKVSFSSHLYNFVFYHLDATGHLDYEAISKIAKEEKPDLILSGYSAYPYAIDFKKFREIADSVNALLMVDMAHIAGLVATGVIESPIPYADIVTTTTHKTLRGPRGGLILTNSDTLIKKINSAIFPYYQGGPLEHIIAGKAICFKEAMSPSFVTYTKKIMANTKACADEFSKLGAIVSGSDNHLFLLNTLESYGITGKEAQDKLANIDITVNKNMLPNDTLTPKETSGLRIGFAALSTRGLKINDARKIAKIINDYLKNKISQKKALEQVRKISASLKKIEEI